ncbi:antitoxin Xre/MbcA/ParS toxin-binding domain-containing protein [Ottowia thiooxydans]|uniref:antitoxin Xre/MbcA/ParS toxin-binding domain-containing protein n=1 Tax=Ottowia thiooxydans TaxID=219182 RepID=UPI000418FE72|nr:antitoxin Xre/MbcA/ParS toxin-binding domain-containing protein [Ottowia thiooxydans]
MKKEEDWLNAVPVGREFGSPDHERLMDLDQAAYTRFRSREKARNWLDTPCEDLDGLSPEVASTTPQGMAQVMILLDTQAVDRDLRTEARASLETFLSLPGDSDDQQSASLPGEGVVLEQSVKLDSFAPLASAIGYSIITRGVPSAILEPLGEYLDLTPSALTNLLGLDLRTTQRAAITGQKLPVQVAECVLRLLEMNQLARDVFDSDETALAWLNRPHPMLAGRAPFDWARSAYGSERVKEILIACKHGGAV